MSNFPNRAVPRKTEISHRASLLGERMDPQDKNTIIGALQIAIDQYRQDAADCTVTPRIREEFERYIEQCEALLDGLQ